MEIPVSKSDNNILGVRQVTVQPLSGTTQPSDHDLPVKIVLKKATMDIYQQLTQSMGIACSCHSHCKTGSTE